MKRIFLMICAFSMAHVLNAQTINDGYKAIDNDQFNTAKGIFIKQLGAAGDIGPQAYLGLMKAYFETGNSDSAALVARKGAALFPISPFSKIMNGRLSISSKDEAAAKVFFDDAVKMTPKDSRIFQYIGDAWLDANTLSGNKAAIDVLTAGLKIDAKNPELYILLGDAYKRDQNGGGQAATNYDKAADLKTADAKAYQRIGAIYTEARNLESAKAAFDKSLAADSKYAATYRDYGIMYYQFKKYDDAVEKYKMYLSMTDTSIENLTRLVYGLHQAKKYNEEIPIINRLMEMDSTNNTLNRLQAYSRAEQKKDPLNDSIGLIYMEIFLKNVEPTKIISLDYKYYGRLLFRTGKDSLAIIELAKALYTDSTDLDVMQEYADVLYKSKRYDAASVVYQMKIDNTRGQSALDYYNLGRSYYFNKNYFAADTAFMKIVELKPNASTGYYWRGRCATRLYPDSIEFPKEFYSKFLEIADVAETKEPLDNLIEGWDFMAVYCVKNDDLEKANEYLNKILEKKPDYQRAKDLKEQLKKQKEQPKKP